MTNLMDHASLWNVHVWLGGGWIVRNEMVSINAGAGKQDCHRGW